MRKNMTIRQLADGLPSALRLSRMLLAMLFVASTLVLPARPATAQAGPPPMPGDAAQPGDGVDPPARVGRLSYIDGTVSFHTLDEDQWEPAVVNYPVTEGLSFWTEPGSRATLQLGHGVVRLDGGTEVDVQQFNDQIIQINVPQGSVNFRLRRLDPDESYQITTPSGTVQLTAPGRYHVDAGANGGQGSIAIFRGSAQPVGDNFGMVISSGPQAQPQDIDAWSDQQETQVAQTPNYVSPDMPGVDDLAGQGSWDRAPDYGAVWYPPVEVGWAPYRYGHWAFVPPWGWTWVDDARWGFAPFHYGRWVQIGPRWAWVPGERVERPVYAPALVAFVGGSNFGVSIGIGGSAVGWVPLGPREVYVPPYGGSIDYVRRVNRTNVTNVNNITINNITVNRTTTNFVNASAATVVRSDTMTRSAHVATAAVKVTPAVLSTATVNNQPQVKPTSATVGAGPTVVKALGGNVSEDQRRNRAPGPKVEAKPLPATLVKPLVTTPSTTGGPSAPGTKITTPTPGPGTGTNPNAGTTTGNQNIQNKGTGTTGAPGPNNRFSPAAGAGTGTAPNTNTQTNQTNQNKGTGAPGPNPRLPPVPSAGAGAGTGQGTGTGTGQGTGTNQNTNTNTGNKNIGAPGPNNRFAPAAGAGTGTNPNANTPSTEGNQNKGTGAPGPNNRFAPATGAGTGTGQGTGTGTNQNTNTNQNPNTNTGNKNVGAPGPNNRFTPATGPGTGTNPNVNTGNKGGQPQGGGQPEGGGQNLNKGPVQTNAPKPPPPPPPQQGGGNKTDNKQKCDPKVQKCPPPQP